MATPTRWHGRLTFPTAAGNFGKATGDVPQVGRRIRGPVEGLMAHPRGKYVAFSSLCACLPGNAATTVWYASSVDQSPFDKCDTVRIASDYVK